MGSTRAASMIRVEVGKGALGGEAGESEVGRCGVGSLLPASPPSG